MTDHNHMPASLNGDCGYASGRLLLARQDENAREFRTLLRAAAGSAPFGVVSLVIAQSEMLLELMQAHYGISWRDDLEAALQAIELEHSFAASDSTSADDEGTGEGR